MPVFITTGKNYNVQIWTLPVAGSTPVGGIPIFVRFPDSPYSIQIRTLPGWETVGLDAAIP